MKVVLKDASNIFKQLYLENKRLSICQRLDKGGSRTRTTIGPAHRQRLEEEDDMNKDNRDSKSLPVGYFKRFSKDGNRVSTKFNSRISSIDSCDTTQSAPRGRIRHATCPTERAASHTDEKTLCPSAKEQLKRATVQDIDDGRRSIRNPDLFINNNNWK